MYTGAHRGFFSLLVLFVTACPCLGIAYDGLVQKQVLTFP